MKKNQKWLLFIFVISIILGYAKYSVLNNEWNKLVWYTNELPDNMKIEEEKDPLKTRINEDIACLKLHAISACLLDASANRVLYEKNGYEKMPMASTTKIMTLIVTLENADLSEEVVVSSNAAKQPDVQLNINTGEKYRLEDLLYSLMLESHNDVAVAIAEHVGGSVEEFCKKMTEKAQAIGAMQTNFITPNGLDADRHYTTAADLALIGSYAILNEQFRKITATATYSFRELTKGRSFTVNNKDQFLHMMDGAIGIKTGFTGKAGYCFVGALAKEDKTLVSVVLGSGWPPNKRYKWNDTKELMSYGIDNYKEADYFTELFSQQPDFVQPTKISVLGGQMAVGELMYGNIEDKKLLLREDESVWARAIMPDYLTAPVPQGARVGNIEYYINNVLLFEQPVYLKEEIKSITYPFVIKELIQLFF